MIKDNIAAVRERIDAAAKRAGRDPEEIKLIAVSKTMPVEMLKEAYEAGQRDFGENRVQELVPKMEELPADIRWHLIGQLQKNKVKYISGKTELIHSVDSIGLAQFIDKEAKKRGVVSDILLEVNIAGEESKSGFKPEEVLDAAEQISALDGVRIRGLMTVAPLVANAEDNRIYFRNLKHLYIDMQNKNMDNSMVDTLSMGMSGDFEVAVEEGATMVRVGTAIFGKRSYEIT
ncbi:MAG: YggS family pyridoxal phosphate-dependent enzyme [Lachnospiraceae bacterium]|nr:YggS family pyridoxal phosphate-dependent enzyme [Lachnospiraceae bacterium]